MTVALDIFSWRKCARSYPENRHPAIDERFFIDSYSSPSDRISNCAFTMTVHSKTICILTGAHLCHNPRVIKEATTLSMAGFNVIVLGAFFDEELKRRDLLLLEHATYRFVPVVDWTLESGKRSLSRLTSRFGRFAHQKFGIENTWQLGNSYPFLKRAAMQTSADLYICHMEQALVIGASLRRSGRRVGIDMEDWHSEDLSAPERLTRPVKLLRRLEKYLLSNGEFSVCTSQSMAGSLAATYRCKRPQVVYNTFPWAERNTLDHQRKDKAATGRPSLYWFSQTIGPGRGLEDLVAALPSLPQELEIHLRGHPSPGYMDWLASRMPADWQKRLFLHDPVHNTEILSRISEHDIGFAGEQPESRSRNVTVSNKLFHYMLGGLAVVASDTAGQREIAADVTEGVRLYQAGDALSLSREINRLLDSTNALEAAKAASLHAAEVKYNWEIESAKLRELVTSALVGVGDS